MIFGICDSLLRLLFGERTSQSGTAADDESTGVATMYFRDRDIDRGLVERLLWWEGVEAPR